MSNYRICGPLPSWLATTFLSLSRKHPLRLLLPPELAETTVEKSEVISRSIEPIPEEIPGTSNGIFAFEVPPLGPAQPISPLSARPSLLSETHTFVESTAYMDRSIPDFSRDLPLSTPGPGTLLGSTTEATAVSISAQASSPTLYAVDSYADEEISLASEPFRPLYLSDMHNEFTDLQYDREHSAYSDDYDSSMMEDLGNNPHFQNIFARPGPAHSVCAPIPLHFEDPTEDPLSSSPSSSGHEIGYNDLDFQWKPFDRRKLIAPTMPDYFAFAYGPKEREAFGDTGKVDLVNALKLCATPNGSFVSSPDSPASPVALASPNPFHFVPPEDDSDPREFTVSQFREQPEKETVTSLKRAFLPAPGISIASPVALASPNPFRFVPPEDDSRPRETAVYQSREQPEEAVTFLRRAFAPPPGISISPLHLSREHTPSRPESVHLNLIVPVCPFLFQICSLLRQPLIPGSHKRNQAR